MHPQHLPSRLWRAASSPRLASGLITAGALFATACGSSDVTSSTSSLSPNTPSFAISASSVPSLGAASGFTLLGATALTCTDATVIGDVGASAGGVVNTRCLIAGAIHSGDAPAAGAGTNFVSAYGSFGGVPCDHVLTTLAGATLAPGVYCFDAASTTTGGQLTLNGPASGIWLFKIGTGGTGALTGTSFNVVLQGGATPCSVFWWTAEAATMTDSHFLGTILAGTSVTLTRGSFDGRALAKVAVTVTGTTVTGTKCGAPPPPPPQNCKGKSWAGSRGDCPVVTPPPTSLLAGKLVVCKATTDGSSGRFQVDVWMQFPRLFHTVGVYINAGECKTIKTLDASQSPATMRVLENLSNGDPGFDLVGVTRMTSTGTEELSGNRIGSARNPVSCTIDLTHGCLIIVRNASTATET